MEDALLKQSNTIAAIRSRKDLTELRTLLKKRPLELLLFEMGICSGLKINELLALRVRDITAADSPEVYPFLTVPHVEAALQQYIYRESAAPDDFVFRKKRKNEPLSFSAISTMVKSWFEQAGIAGHYSSRSLYYTWQYSSRSRPAGSSHGGASEAVPSWYDLAPLNINSVEVQVQEELFKGIITGTLPAGTRLSAGRLAKQLEVNVVSVKVALAHLEEQGLVEPGKRKTFIVKAFTPDDIIEISNIRVVLEDYALERIRFAWSQKTSVLLEQILAKWERSRDVVECVHYHSLFHSMLFRDTHMPLLLGYIRNLSNRMNALHIRTYATKGEMNGNGDMDITAHKLILQTIQAGNFDKAKQLIHSNIVEGRKNCLAHIPMLRNQQDV